MKSKSNATPLCPVCGVGHIATELLENYKTQVAGIDVVIPTAEVLKCDHCKKMMFGPTHLKEWNAALREQLSRGGSIPSPDAVRQIRTHFNMTVAQAAALFGVTRQAVYGWESKSGDALQLGPAAILWRLLDAERNQKLKGVFKTLWQEARARGHALDENVVTPDPISSKPMHLKQCRTNFWEREKTKPV